MAMNDEMFAELMSSVEDAGRIAAGKAKPSRVFTVENEPVDVVRISEGHRLSQTRFAALLGISVKTLRNWEQGRRVPVGPARVLLQVAAKHPDAFWDVVRETSGRQMVTRFDQATHMLAEAKADYAGEETAADLDEAGQGSR